jgi:hypothetical protein
VGLSAWHLSGSGAGGAGPNLALRRAFYKGVHARFHIGARNRDGQFGFGNNISRRFPQRDLSCNPLPCAAPQCGAPCFQPSLLRKDMFT